MCSQIPIWITTLEANRFVCPSACLEDWIISLPALCSGPLRLQALLLGGNKAMKHMRDTLWTSDEEARSDGTRALDHVGSLKEGMAVLSSHQTTVTGTWKHLKSTFKTCLFRGHFGSRRSVCSALGPLILRTHPSIHPSLHSHVGRCTRFQYRILYCITVAPLPRATATHATCDLCPCGSGAGQQGRSGGQQ